ncbi:MAG: NUDIX domain-containing protein [Candidatus Daviesbacteria bacterium]|nr:NUDIX domain-containing protein [Candidatus Daviesbacteria bacterium]
MLDEVYDVVDKKGRKIGTATWTEVHTKGLLHQNVHCIVFQDRNLTKTLFKKRVSNSAQEAGKYEIAAAGHMFAGEKPEESIRRELEEELFGGKKIPNNIKMQKVATYFNHDLPNNNEIAYLYLVIHPGPFTIQVAEAENFEWVDWKDLIKDMRDNPTKYAQYSINAVNAYIKSWRS